MTNEVAISANWVTDAGQSRPLEALRQAVAARARLIGETSERATIATAIAVLKSLRAETGKVGRRPIVIEGNWVVDIRESGAVPGWAAPGRRVVRRGSTGRAEDRYNGGRIVNLAGNYARGRNGRAFTLSIRNTMANPSRPFYPAQGDCYMVIATTREDVEKFARQRILRRICQYRGVSKKALGIAMHAVSSSGAGEAVTQDVARIVGRLVHAKTYGTGYGAGEFGVSVADDLPRALLALKSGPDGVDIALKKAANATAAIISRKMSAGFGERVEAPFPEVVKRRVGK